MRICLSFPEDGPAEQIRDTLKLLEHGGCTSLRVVIHNGLIIFYLEQSSGG